MGAKVKIEHISEGWRTILNSSEVQAVCHDYGEEVRQATGMPEHFRVDDQIGGYGGGRAITWVTASDYTGRRAEAKDKVLTRAVH